MTTAQAHREYFEDQVANSTPEFWRRFGAVPEVAGKRALDLGCGHGALALDLASRGASVLAVDLDADRVEWAAQNVHPSEGSIDFQVADVTALGLADEFDLIVSKDTFEHIEQLDQMLVHLRRALKPTGEIWAGFSPLYYSPWGDHGRTGMVVPWAHVLPRRLVYSAATRHQGQPVRSLADIGLNGLTPAQFRSAVDSAGLEIKSILYNQGDKRLMPALSYLRRFRPLERYATVGIYTILRRRS